MRALALTKTVDRHDVKLYVGITDYDWFILHTSKESVHEVDFWQAASRYSEGFIEARKTVESPNYDANRN